MLFKEYHADRGRRGIYYPILSPSVRIHFPLPYLQLLLESAQSVYCIVRGDPVHHRTVTQKIFTEMKYVTLQEIEISER